MSTRGCASWLRRVGGERLMQRCRALVAARPNSMLALRFILLVPFVAALAEPNGHLEAGYAFAAEGDLERARQAFDSAVHLEPTS